MKKTTRNNGFDALFLDVGNNLNTMFVSIDEMRPFLAAKGISESEVTKLQRQARGGKNRKEAGPKLDRLYQRFFAYKDAAAKA